MFVSEKKQAFINGQIYTVNKNQAWAEAILVIGNKIQKVGSNKEINLLIDGDTSIIDLKNKMVLPGFIDAHTHVFIGEIMKLGLQFELLSTKEELLNTIKEYSIKNKDKDFILGVGFSAGTFGDNTPTAKELDMIISDKPALFLDEGCHSMWVNTKTLEMANITKDTKDPIPKSDYYKRDKDGNPTGWIVEAKSMIPVMKKLGLLEKILDSDLKPMFDMFASYGITSVFNASEYFFSTNSLAPINYMQNLANNNQSTFRFFTSYSYNSHDSDKDPVEILNKLNQEYTSDYVRIDTLKIWLDGTVEVRNAALSEPYLDTGELGKVFYNTEELQEAIDRAKSYGLSIHLHAIGDKTIDTALDVCKNAMKKFPNAKGTQTIAHNEVFNKNTVANFTGSNIIANTTPIWHGAYDGLLEALGEERYNNLYQFNSLIDNDVLVTFGSDYPTGLGEVAMNVFHNIQVGHTRAYVGETETLPSKTEELSIENLIKGYTINAATQLSMQDKIGSIEEGKYADFIVLKENLFEQAATDIHKNSVIKTVFDGKIIYER